MTDSLDDDEIRNVGPYILKKVKSGLTSAGIEPTYAICTPDRWGLRYSDVDKDRPNNLAYPLAHEYAYAVHGGLIEKIRWGNNYFGSENQNPEFTLTWPIDDSQFERLADQLRPIMATALTSKLGGFGLPENAIPQIASYTPSNPFEQGCFVPNRWKLNLTLNKLKKVFDVNEVAPTLGERQSQTFWLKQFADTLYHEARHCQQYFWAYALIIQHPENFPGFTEISKFPALTATEYMRGSDLARVAVNSASKASIPDDVAACISLKRMAVGIYLQNVHFWIKGEFWPPYFQNLDETKKHYEIVRSTAIDLLHNVGLGGTPIDVDAMVEQRSGCTCSWDYSGRPWENDAFFCGDMATAYWKTKFGLALHTHAEDQCSQDYERDYRHKPSAGTNEC
ncbi:hypothetical protein [Paraburkholderia bannensis]|uniref:hypothetical protein n=1 Tax=Paraburkholderia bannensis TaxID=765414 RepID=UPI002ABD44AD|nr:hypothetical protein [Paraburkholderia bannensis]